MRILILTNTAEGRYGYSVVFDSVAKGLRDAGHEIIYFGLQEVHPPIKIDDITYLGVRYDAFGQDITGDYCRAFKVDALLVGMDVWLDQLQFLPNVTKALNIPLITHVTVNSSPLSPFLARFLSQCDYIVCPSMFAYNEITSVFKDDIYQISHGVDMNTYKPLPNEIKEEMKKRLKVENKEFILLTVMRNKSPLQKNFAALFNAWKTLLVNVPELQTKGILLCLTDPMEVGSIRLDMLRDRAGLRDLVKFIWAKPTKDFSSIEMTYEGDPEGLWHNANINFSSQEMAKLYNIANVFVVSSFGESFNLPCLESMACGIPQVNSKHTTGFELVGDPKTGLLADIAANLTNPLITDQWIVEPTSLSNCIQKLHSDKDLWKECSRNALEFAKNFEWKTKIIPQWIKLFEKVENDMMQVDYKKNRLGV